jgi:hypothetical protein
MYASNGSRRKRLVGWVERRRYFRRLLAQARPQDEDRPKEKQDANSK